MALPNMIRIRQHFEAPEVDDIAGTVKTQITGLNLQSRVKTGDSVAITVGIRGFNEIALITKSIVDAVKDLGGEPFIVPAMGSHGGGTAEGQQQIVESYGVTAEYVGCEIRATMDVVQVGTVEGEVPVYFDKYAAEADHVVVAGRIKPHTGFVGEIESGLHKMMLIGLGKHKGAALYHQAIVQYSFDRIIRAVASEVIDKCGILFGLAIVENQYDHTAMIEAVAPENFDERERELLVLAKKWMPRLPFDRVDLLVIDEIGKNISGSGLDSNVVGRKFYEHCAAEKEFPKVTRILVRDLTPETHGNAAGVGTSEYIHQRVIDKMDVESTVINCMTGNAPSGAAIPIAFPTDRECMEKALETVGYVAPENARVLRIRNTLQLGELWVSEAYADEVEKREDLSVVTDAAPMELDDQGDLLTW
ncbi:MAG: lactate racemase domain-containing protein [Candidatus Latescibacterota bacterium]|nr:lactate racemase domain-containing protein [Candidatus Latescibacterota bacterium]